MGRPAPRQMNNMPDEGRDELPQTIPYHIAERIRMSIITWRYPPGSNLREVDLCAEFGSSRGPVREALRLLELRGLVEHAPRRGFRVSEHNEDGLRHLYLLRTQLEGTVIEALAVKDVNELAEQLERINEAMRDCASHNDIHGYFALNMEFHQSIIDRTESNILIRVLSIVNDMSLPVRFMLLSTNFPKKSDYTFHKRILQAIRHKELKAARQLTESHIRENLFQITKMYRQRLAESAIAPTEQIGQPQLQPALKGTSKLARKRT